LKFSDWAKVAPPESKSRDIPIMQRFITHEVSKIRGNYVNFVSCICGAARMAFPPAEK